jgi:hypothetical protein
MPLPDGVDPSALPVGTDVLAVLLVGWIGLRVAVLWI